MEGTRLGPYRIVSELGSGGMGRVWLAEAVERCAVPAGTRAALKVVHPHLLSEPGIFKRFLREAEIGKAVTHPNVVRCHDCDQLVVDGQTHAFLVMEYVEGQTLRGLLDEMETIPEELCRHIGREVSKGLAAIHGAGVVHRDLKPENVLITPEHEVKIMDLGVARLADAAIRLSQTGMFVGSPQYAAPEQYKGGGKDLDGRADLHALGLILYELSSGSHPYRADDVHQVLRKVLEEKPRRLGDVNPQLSAFFEEVVHCLIAKDRDRRFASATRLFEVLDEGERSTWWGRRARALRAETKRPLRRIRIPRETAVYGREEELGRFKALYEKARNGDGRVVLIEGEAGIGKTRLVDELIGRLQHDGEDLNFLFGSYPPGGAATASGAWSTAYREHFGAEGLEEALATYLAATPLLVPAFAALLRGDAPPAGREPLNRDSLQTAFVGVTRALATERPTVVLVEDLHFAPEEGRALFAALAHAVPTSPVLLVGTHRPGLPGEWVGDLDRLDHFRRIDLARLGPKDLARLLEDALRSRRLAETLGFRIGEKSDGNPFFVFEILRGLREGRFITRRPDGTWATTQVIREIRFPSSVSDLIQARITGLEERDQELLDVAACVGFLFEPGIVAEVVGEARVPALRRLARLEKVHRLVRSSGREFIFDHHQIQESLYAAIPLPLREEYHAAIGAALAARHPDPTPDQAVALCGHCLRGRDGARALPHLDRALGHLEAGFLNSEAAELARAALELPGLLEGPRRVDVLLRRAERLELRGVLDEEAGLLTEAVAIAEAEGPDRDGIRARTALGWAHVRAQKYEEGRELLDAALRDARSLSDPMLEGRALEHLHIAYSREGRHDRALEVSEQAVALARETGDVAGEGRALHYRAANLARLGRGDAALASAERAYQVARDSSDRRTEANALSTLGALRGMRGDMSGAAASLASAAELLREIGDRPGLLRTLSNLAIAFMQSGGQEGARAVAEEGLEISIDMGDRWEEARARQTMGLVQFDRGEFDAAAENIRVRVEYAREIRDEDSETRALIQLGNCRIATGRLAEASDAYGRAHGIARANSDGRLERSAALGLANVYALVGVPEPGLSLLDAFESDAEAASLKAHQPSALETRGELLELTGDLEAAAECWQRATDLLHGVSQAWGETEARLGLARVEAGLGHREAALEQAGAALRIAREIDHRLLLPLAECTVAALTGEGLDEAAALLEERGDRMMANHRLLAWVTLWRATGDPRHLERAHGVLVHLRDHAPEEHRESMIRNVPLHRDVMAAWEEHGGAD